MVASYFLPIFTNHSIKFFINSTQKIKNSRSKSI